MKKRIMFNWFVSALFLSWTMIWAGQTSAADNGGGQPNQAAQQADQGQKPKDNKFPPFAKVIEGAQKLDGLFTLYWNKEDGKLFAEIKPNQMNKPLLSPIAIARGLGMAGHPLHQMDQWVLMFRRSGDKMHIVRRNVHYEADQNSPIQKAVEQNYTDSIIKAVPIRSVKGKNVLIDLADIYFGDFAQLGLGGLDRNRTSWHQVKSFKNNIELEVEATFSGGGFYYSYGFGDSGVIDNRGITLVIHYSLVNLPNNGYSPRFADNRVGHFLNATKDYNKEDPDTFFVRRINRWNLEKANPQAPLSPPKQQIVWWVENTVPYEFRPYVEEGILEWNKAFEKVGIKNALAVRWQGEGDDFDPENVDYCTFKWLTSGSTYAMSGIRANPITGEIVDGDVVFDASWIKYWKNQYAFLVGSAASTLNPNQHKVLMPVAKGEIISPILATAEGFGLPYPLPGRSQPTKPDSTLQGSDFRLVPEQWNPLQLQVRKQIAGRGGYGNFCQFNSFQSYQLGLAAIAMAHEDNGDENENDGEDEGEDEDENGEEKDKEKKKDEPDKLPSEFLGQAIKEVVMHEVGHSLGLRHNFKASTIHQNKHLHDKQRTQPTGLVGSVMDYNPINIAADRNRQGDYFPTTIGPYDYWAIEYAYKPVRGNEEKALDEIASRSPEPDLVYATDEDLYMNHDPYVNTYDLGADPIAFGRSRIQLASKLFDDLDQLTVKEGESWARLRNAFSILLAQYGDAASLAANFIGGQQVHRDHKGENARDPVVPIPGSKQREALDFVVDHILSDDAFDFSPQLLRRLTTERWYHWGSSSMTGVDYPLYERILSIQRIVLNHCFNASMLKRLQNHRVMVGEDAKPLEISEVFRKLTDGIWADLDLPESAEHETHDLDLSIIQRNLQRAHLERLTRIVLGSQGGGLSGLYSYVFILGGSGSYPPDAKSLAKLHLREIKGLASQALERDDIGMSPTTQAHLAEVQERLTKILNADLQVSDAW